MRIMVCLVVAAFLFGCGQAPPPKAKGKPVSVGMAYQDATPLLTGAGGMHVDLDNIKGTETHLREVSKYLSFMLILSGGVQPPGYRVDKMGIRWG